MRSIVRVWVHPVLIGRDEERRPPVHLRAVPPPSCSLPTLRQGPPLLFAALQRPGAASLGAPCRAALPEQPPSQACRAALPRTPPCPGCGHSGPRAESDASPFDRRAPAFCCGAHAGVWNPALRARPSRPGVPLRALRSVLRRSIRACARREGSEMAIDKQTRAEIQRLYFAEKWRIGTIARQRPPRHGRARGSGGRGAHASEAAQGFDDRSVVHPPDLGGLAALQPALPDGGRARLPGKREPLPAHDRARAPAARGLSAPQGPASRLRWTGLTSAR